MNLKRLSHTDQDPWYWRRAAGADLAAIIRLTEQYYSCEIDGIFTPNPTRLQYHLQLAIVEQAYKPNEQLLTVACDRTTGQLIGWAWLKRGEYTVYADEELACPEIVHVDLTLPKITRMRLTIQIIEQWIAWCQLNNIAVLTSSSVRTDQTAFMRVHEALGFVVHGSFAYLRILK
jgi:hypothetical protein